MITTTSTTVNSSTHNNSTRYVVLRFDDGLQSQYVYALPILQQYNFSASFFAVTSAIQNGTIPDTVQQTGENMNWQELEWLYHNGYEIVDHSATHPDMDQLSSSQLAYEVNDSRQDMISHGITYIPDFALPYGDGDTNQSLLSYIYSAGFLHVWGAFEGQVGISNYQLDSVFIPIDYADNDTSLCQFESFADQASSTFVVGFEFHDIEVNSSDVNSTNPYALTLAQFEEEMAWLSSNGYTVVSATALPGYNSTSTSTTTATSTASDSVPALPLASGETILSLLSLICLPLNYLMKKDFLRLRQSLENSSEFHFRRT